VSKQDRPMIFKRFDGTPAQGVPDYRRMIPFIMPTKTESVVQFEQVVDLTRTLPFIDRFNEGSEHRITVFHILLGALARMMGERPRLNRFISGRRHYDRKGLWFSFAAKKRLDDDAPLSVVKREFPPDEPFADMVARLKYVFDERVEDGLYCAKALDLLKGHIEDPEPWAGAPHPRA
jgi:hypothetical protein